MTTDELTRLHTDIALETTLAADISQGDKCDVCSLEIFQSCARAVRRCHTATIDNPESYIRAAAWRATKQRSAFGARKRCPVEIERHTEFAEHRTSRTESINSAKEMVEHMLSVASPSEAALLQAMMISDNDADLAKCLKLSPACLKRAKASLRRRFNRELRKDDNN